MEEVFLTKLRDKDTSMADFRMYTEKLAHILAQKTFQLIRKKKIRVKTHVILIPILRSGMALLSAFLFYFPEASVGFIGLRRDEKTAIAAEYYRNIPQLKKNDIIIFLDPMLATGGSAVKAIEIVKAGGVPEENMIFNFLIAAPEGIRKIEQAYPKVQKIIFQTDDHLNAKKFIVPGIGDFGDRYFGTTVEGEG